MGDHGYFFDRDPYPCGHEGSGTIVAIGKKLKTPYKIGDRVHVAELGTYGQYVLAETKYISPFLETFLLKRLPVTISTLPLSICLDKRWKKENTRLLFTLLELQLSAE